jgi:hypothetical protein
MAHRRPKGSGWFAAGAGVIFLVASVCSFVWDLSKIPPYLLFKVWLLIAAAILLGWGIRRIMQGRDDWTVGQNTINFVVAILGLTIAILTIVVTAPPRP